MRRVRAEWPNRRAHAARPESTQTVIHPHTELRFINSEIGYGVVATRRIPKGTITWVLDKLDQVFKPEEIKEMGEVYTELIDTYAYRNSQGEFVLCWDNARCVNHSFNSNCLSTAYDFELAIRDIEVGEQLTDDYGYLNVSEPFVPVDEGLPRKTVYPDDVLKYRQSWDRSLLSAFRHLPDVEQPLRRILPPETWELSLKIAAGEEEMASIAENYFKG